MLWLDWRMEVRRERLPLPSTRLHLAPPAPPEKARRGGASHPCCTRRWARLHAPTRRAASAMAQVAPWRRAPRCLWVAMRASCLWVAMRASCMRALRVGHPTSQVSRWNRGEGSRRARRRGAAECCVLSPSATGRLAPGRPCQTSRREDECVPDRPEECESAGGGGNGQGRGGREGGQEGVEMSVYAYLTSCSCSSRSRRGYERGVVYRVYRWRSAPRGSGWDRARCRARDRRRGAA